MIFTVFNKSSVLLWQYQCILADVFSSIFKVVYRSAQSNSDMAVLKASIARDDPNIIYNHSKQSEFSYV